MNVGQFTGAMRHPMSALVDLAPLSKEERNYVVSVFSYLGGGMLGTVFGVWFAIRIFAVPMFLSLIGQMICGIYIQGSSTYRNENEDFKRKLAFGGFSFFMGSTIAPLIPYANSLNPSIVPTAFAVSLALFACFTGAALFTNSRKTLYLGGWLSAGVTFFLLIGIFNMFSRSAFVHDFYIYGTLILYFGFCAYDTQVCLEDYKNGRRDALAHAVGFYIDLFGIFVRVLVILINKEEKKKEKENK